MSRNETREADAPTDDVLPDSPPKSLGTPSTLSDVARRAGVSLATASTVLNNPRSNTRVSEATRERIQDAARVLRYHPNAHARSLLGRKTATIGVVFGLERATVAVANPYVFTVFQGIVAGAAEAGHNVTLFTDPWHGAERSAASFRDRRTDGLVIIAPTTNSDILPSLTEFGIPLVSVGSTDEGLAPSSDVDNAIGARLAVQHLLTLGHTRIAHLPGDGILLNSVLRERAFLAAMKEAALPVPPEYLQPGFYTSTSGYERTLRLLDLPHPPTAIFAANDNVARGVLRATRERGVVVPGELSVVGFDGLPGISTSTPVLTTIRQPLVEIGHEAARLLLRRINGEEVPPRPHLFAPELVIGDSTAPPNPDTAV